MYNCIMSQRSNSPILCEKCLVTKFILILIRVVNVWENPTYFENL